MHDADGPQQSPPSPLSSLATLWRLSEDDPRSALLPKDAASLAGFYDALKLFVAQSERRLEGTVDPAAIVRGDLVAMGKGSVIEAGAIIHDSARVVLGERARVRSGAVLRDEVVVGPDCLVGAHCEVFRSLLLGPEAYVGHMVILADSVLGRDVRVSGGVIFASSKLRPGPIRLQRGSERVDSGRSHLGALVGDGVRLGAGVLLCPGCIVLPGVVAPPRCVLHGTIDTRRAEELTSRFFSDWVEGGPP